MDKAATEIIDEAPAGAAEPQKPKGESTLWNVSIRGIIALIFVLTMSALCFGEYEIDDKLFAIVSTVVGFYFGQNSKHGQSR